MQHGDARLLALVGPAGVGKSAFTDAWLERLGALRCATRCDPLAREIPYAPIVAALRELTQQLLATAEAEFSRWRVRLGERVGDQFDLGGVHAQGGQRDGGGHVGVLGFGRLVRFAAEVEGHEELALGRTRAHASGFELRGHAPQARVRALRQEAALGVHHHQAPVVQQARARDLRLGQAHPATRLDGIDEEPGDPHPV